MNFNIGKKEIITQKRVIDLLQKKLNYTYLGDWTERNNNQNIEEELVFSFLLRNYSRKQSELAINELQKISNNKTLSLYARNKLLYNLLKYGIQVKEDTSDKKITVQFIDWNNSNNNHFSFAEEVTVKFDQYEKRPDLVFYINGISLAILELKRSIVSVEEGIRQNIDSQKPEFIRDFFTTNQIILSGNDSQGLRYGAIGTPEKHYLPWKENTHTDVVNKLDREVLQFFEKNRLLDFIHNCVAFDNGVKKIARPHQYFALKSLKSNLDNKKGGIIWHTQGAGKSLLMIWAAKMIKQSSPNARVLIVTDREELDNQIKNTFGAVGEEITRATGGQDLINLLNKSTPTLMCSLIHKFGTGSNNYLDDYLKDLGNIPQAYSAKGDIVVFVDECHRTQSGKLHKAMRELMPNAIFVGFTGTPLLQADKITTLQTFGDFIHTYKFDEAVADEVILDLRYEARDVDTFISDSDAIDTWFEAKTKGLTDKGKVELKKRWGKIKTLYSSKHRIEKIAANMLLDFNIKPRLANDGRGTAMLVATSIEDACKYYERFKEHLGKKCAIITSFKPNSASIKGDTSGDEESASFFKYSTYLDMISNYLNISKEDAKKEENVAEFEKRVLKQFKEEPANMKLLIVVNKLLTGFDAPSATYIYLDKKLQDHNLFQAICRTNRLDDGKDFGYIIDYRNQFESITDAMTNYTQGAFSGYDPVDILGLLSDRKNKTKNIMETALYELTSICSSVKEPKDETDYISYFCGDTSITEEVNSRYGMRSVLYSTISKLLKSYADIANDLSDLGYDDSSITKLKGKVAFYEHLMQTIKLASGDYIDLKKYDHDMKFLIDTYIEALPSKVISNLNDKTLLEVVTLLEKELETNKKEQEKNLAIVIGNTRKILVDEEATNPMFFNQLSKVLESIIEERRKGILDYQKFLNDLNKKVLSKLEKQENNERPKSIDNELKKTLYDNLGNNEQLTLELIDIIDNEFPSDWVGHKMKERTVRNKLSDKLNDTQVDNIFNILRAIELK